MELAERLKTEEGCLVHKRGAPARPTIALLTNYPYDSEIFTGGVETATAGLLEGLVQYSDEFDFHIISLSREIVEHKVEQRCGMTFHFIAIPNRWYRKPNVISNAFNARAVLNTVKADLVHCQDNMALAVGALMTKPVRKLFTVHGIKAIEARVWEGPEYWSNQMDALLERWVRRRFDEVITISPYVDRFLPIHVKKHHITNPVRKIFFESPQCGGGTHRVLFVGALTRLKRPLDVIKAFELVKKEFADASLSIVGQPEDVQYKNELKRYVADAGLEGVEFRGACTQKEVASLMRVSSALVLASVQENTPMVIAEAMASGLPVIASRVGGVSMMVNDGVDGLLFECGSVRQIAGHILRLFGDGVLRNQLSSKGRGKAVAAFYADAVAASTVTVYKSILGMNPHE